MCCGSSPTVLQTNAASRLIPNIQTSIILSRGWPHTNGASSLLHLQSFTDLPPASSETNFLSSQLRSESAKLCSGRAGARPEISQTHLVITDWEWSTMGFHALSSMTVWGSSSVGAAFVMQFGAKMRFFSQGFVQKRLSENTENASKCSFLYVCWQLHFFRPGLPRRGQCVIKHAGLYAWRMN